MRSVEGKTDHVVVVGAGLSGLSAALQLAGRGRTVTVVERADVPGGLVGRADIGGYQLDTGPTVLTMPDILDDAFAAVGASTSDYLTLDLVEPAYHASFADGSSLNVHSDPAKMTSAIEDFAGANAAGEYLRLREWLTKLYHAEMDSFVGANFDSPLSLLTPQLAKLAALGGFRRWDRVIRQFIKDDRLARVFSFQALYAGVPPQQALAAYAVIAYMDTIAGVYFPRGGMRAMPDALASAATNAGVEFRYGSPVIELERSGSRVSAVRTAADDRIACDAVVLTTPLPLTYQLLGRTPRRLLKVRHAPSAVVVHVGCRAVTSEAGLHTILFGQAWDKTFRDIISDGNLMSDLSLMINRSTAGDPTLAPHGRDLLYILAPAPNLEVGTVDWEQAARSYAQSIVDVVADRLLPELGDDVEILRTITPAGWEREGMSAGTPFALAHTFAQTGPFRPSNTVRGIDNAVLAGSSTVPGVGVPTALLSGRLAADRVTGIVAGQQNARRTLSSKGR